jgi:hypothetical protein
MLGPGLLKETRLCRLAFSLTRRPNDQAVLRTRRSGESVSLPTQEQQARTGGALPHNCRLFVMSSWYGTACGSKRLNLRLNYPVATATGSVPQSFSRLLGQSPPAVKPVTRLTEIRSLDFGYTRKLNRFGLWLFSRRREKKPHLRDSKAVLANTHYPLLHLMTARKLNQDQARTIE